MACRVSDINQIVSQACFIAFISEIFAIRVAFWPASMFWMPGFADDIGDRRVVVLEDLFLAIDERRQRMIVEAGDRRAYTRCSLMDRPP